MPRYIKKTNKITKPTKYTPEFVISELNDMISEVKKNNYYFLGQVFYSRDYHLQRFSEWAHEFEKTSKEIPFLVRQLEALLEHNLVTHTAEGRLDKTMTIFILKNRHKNEVHRTSESWNDTPLIDLSQHVTYQWKKETNQVINVESSDNRDPVLPSRLST